MHTGKGGIARSQLNAANVSGENGTDRAIAAMAPAPLASAPEQALKAEVSEAASEPELLFAPDFIISQVCHETDLMAFYAKQDSIQWQCKSPGLQASSSLLLLLSCTAQTALLTVCTALNGAALIAPWSTLDQAPQRFLHAIEDSCMTCASQNPRPSC